MQQRKDTRRWIAACALALGLAALFAVAPKWVLDVAQVVLWTLGIPTLIASLAGQDDFIKRRARELVRQWDEDGRAPSGLWLALRHYTGRGCWFALVASMACAGYPGLAALYLMLQLHILHCQHVARAFVRQMDDQVRKQLTEYEEATNHPV